MKMLVYKTNISVFGLLDFDDDKIFMEPLLYTYFNTPDSKFTLEQILYGYIRPSARPAEITVYSDEYCYVYLPNLGYFQTSVADEFLTLSVNKETGNIQLHKNGNNLKTEFEPIMYADGTDIEICRHNNCLLATLFEKKEDLQIEHTVSRHTAHLNKAIDRIRNQYPEFYNFFAGSVRKLFLFHSDTHRSFATMIANGVAFFNVKDDDDDVYLIEDITHQSGHVIYYTLLYDKQSFFNTDIDTLINKYNHREHDTRPVLGAFYSLLPFYFSNTCSFRLYNNKELDGRQYHEFIGRFSFRMVKNSIAIGDFRSGEMLTDKGKELVREFDAAFREIDNSVSSFLYKYDVSNQGYGFSYKKFLFLNPAYQ
jgi:hypothetical protein